MRIEAVRPVLDRTDWSFPGTGTHRLSLHGIHWFPGNFIPQIPAFLIRLLSQPGDLVFDPFCGSGTTPSEAVSLGRRAVGADINPAALQVARAKRAVLTHREHTLEELNRALSALTWPHLVYAAAAIGEGIGCATELEVWYSRVTLGQLRGIWNSVVMRSSAIARPLLEAIFTDVLYACASTKREPTRSGNVRRHHWGWIADNVAPQRPSSIDAVELFLERTLRATNIVRMTEGKPHADFSLLQSDGRASVLRPGSVSLVVTSPPYLAMIDYTRASRLTYLWYGWNLRDNLAREIGARARRGRSDVVERYTSDIRGSAESITRVLRPAGHCAIIIGASRRFPEARDAVISEFSQQLELVWGPRLRRPTRRRLSERQGREVEEAICVFRRAS